MFLTKKQKNFLKKKRSARAKILFLGILKFKYEIILVKSRD